MSFLLIFSISSVGLSSITFLLDRYKKNFFNDEIIGFYLSSIDIESGESTTLLFDYSIDLNDAFLSPDP